MNECPCCKKETKYEVYDSLPGFGATDYEETCENCGYSFSFAYGEYEIKENGKLYRYNFRDAELIVKGLATQEDFRVKTYEEYNRY